MRFAKKEGNKIKNQKAELRKKGIFCKIDRKSNEQV